MGLGAVWVRFLGAGRGYWWVLLLVSWEVGLGGRWVFRSSRVVVLPVHGGLLIVGVGFVRLKWLVLVVMEEVV